MVRDPLRSTAGFCRDNALRTAAAGVGQGGGSTSERAVHSATERARVAPPTDRAGKPLDDLALIAGLQQSILPDR